MKSKLLLPTFFIVLALGALLSGCGRSDSGSSAHTQIVEAYEAESYKRCMYLCQQRLKVDDADQVALEYLKKSQNKLNAGMPQGQPLRPRP